MSNNILVTGRFNILHPGHIRLLKFAKELGGKLFVGVESDIKAGSHAYVHEKLRIESLKSNNWVDECFIYNQSIDEIIHKYDINIVVKGKEHENKFNEELEIIKKKNGKLIFSSGESIFSSVDLITKEFSEIDSNTIKIPFDYLERHNFSLEKLHKILSNFSSVKVCVIGDLIMDEYITCQALGMSQEDPTIVVTPIHNTTFIGGAGIVAAHASGLGAEVEFITIVGNDSIKDQALNKLKEYNVKSNLFIDESRPTTLKQRFRSKGKTLLRVSHLHQGPISKELQKDILSTLASKLDNIDLFVFSDFNYGCLPQDLVDEIVKLIKLKKPEIMLVADSQSSSQIGDISRFKNMNLITPTEHEARISTKNYEAGLVILSEEIKKQSSAMNVLLKLGEEGLLINSDNRTFLTDKIGALNSSPKDVSGAGDSLLITSALALACGGTIWEAAFLGSLAASIQVGRVGNTPLTSKELQKNLN
jgi:rfaE bifunctional protein kinase chain/domain